MQTSTLIVPVDNELHLQTENGQVVVSSRVVAERFGKRHSDVVRAIENKIESLTTQNCEVKNLTAENSEVNLSKLFIPTKYVHNGNEYKEYLLTRDGFTFIVMGFTGAEADIWKLKYIEAFNKMEQAIHSLGVQQLERSYVLLNERFNAFSESLTEKINKLEAQAEFNHRPSHATKISWNKVIKSYAKCPADEENIKHIVFARFGISKWEYLTSDKFSEVFGYIREIAEKANLINQISLFDEDKKTE